MGKRIYVSINDSVDCLKKKVGKKFKLDIILSAKEILTY